ncbi:MAG: helix-turn-helix domain-containing protein, partial [Candidatus Dadabacteria bacterium]|nr:helix-turn-helix domain-containing protein [Candidatus Dadabacteria bacterium]
MKKLLNLRELSEIYSIPLSTLRRWASERRFPLLKVSNRILVSPQAFEEWLEQHSISNKI